MPGIKSEKINSNFSRWLRILLSNKPFLPDQRFPLVTVCGA
jgi:hypothetical protein